MEKAENLESESCANNLCQMNMVYKSEAHETETHLKHENLYSSGAMNHENIHTVSSVVKFNGFISDQTPTPTRFLRHYEDVCFLQDINLNPFDLEFRKASQTKNSKVHLSVPEAHVLSGSLETPRILPPIESDETISSTSQDDGQSSSVSENRHHCQLSAIITEVSSPETICRKLIFPLDEKKDGRKRLTLNVSSASEDGQSSSNIISTPTPVITAGPSVSQSLLSIGSSTPTFSSHNNVNLNVPHISLNGVGLGFGDLNTPALSPHYRIPSSPPLTSHGFSLPEPEDRCKRSSEISPKAVPPQAPTPVYGSIPPSTSATVLQLLLRLPDGQAIPVEIPATPVISTVSSCKTTPSIVKSIVPAYPATAFTSVITNPTPSLAKMKLKQVLASSNTAARPGAPRHSRATTADRIADLTKPKAPDTAASNRNSAPYDDCGSSGEGALQGGTTMKVARRKSSFSEENNPEEKRKKFLERNRVAAVRCREKKKRLVECMVLKSDELNSVNQKLQGEITSLRSEVASLKSLLLKHKDCPVTLAMQGEDNSGSEKYLAESQEQFECKQQEKKLSQSSYISSAPHYLSVHPYKEVPRSCLSTSSTSFLVPENPSSLDAVIKFRKRSNSLTSAPSQPILVSSDSVPSDTKLFLPLETTMLKETKRIAPKDVVTLGVVPRPSPVSSLMTQPKIVFIESSSMAPSLPSQR